ncbi:MAG: hypothetical protein K6E34_09250 [Lachnospiraceae bacterium]|nr:hypothetical protein [Lachnospiraceae bacterium]
MTYQEYMEQYGNTDHYLIRMTDVFPFFAEKRIIKGGEERIEKNYHIANGNLITYINYEMDNQICAAVDHEMRIRFENGCGDCPVLITNIGEEKLEILMGDQMGYLKPNEVLGIFPDNLANNTMALFEEEGEKKCGEEGTFKITQSEINHLLDG